MKNLRSKEHLLSIIFKNNRLSDYEDILKKAVTQNYVVCTVTDFYKNRLDNIKDDKFLILRHDIDYITPGTRKMFLLEKKYGLVATYYFRDSTIDTALISELHRDGFEVGYHYETLANMIRRGQVTTRKDIDLEIVRNEFLKELNHFNNIVGFKTTSCAGHGAIENRKIGISNNFIFEDIKSVELGVEVESYNSRLINAITTYISDNGIMYNYGFAYNGPIPTEAMDNNSQVICFLSHPNHWDMTFYQRFKKLFRMVIGKGIYKSNKVFRRVNT